jgi:hypothetical protein
VSLVGLDSCAMVLWHLKAVLMSTMHGHINIKFVYLYVYYCIYVQVFWFKTLNIGTKSKIVSCFLWVCKIMSFFEGRR